MVMIDKMFLQIFHWVNWWNLSLGKKCLKTKEMKTEVLLTDVGCVDDDDESRMIYKLFPHHFYIQNFNVSNK